MAAFARLYALDDVHPGMKLGDDVLDSRNKILLVKGTTLNESLLLHLEHLGVEYVPIETEQPVISIQPIVLEKSKLALLENAVTTLKQAFQVIATRKVVPLKVFITIAENYVLPLALSSGAISYLNVENSAEDYLYHHSVRVGLLSGAMGKWLGYSRTEIKQLTLAGLLHDIGKLTLNQALLDKPVSLSPEEWKLMKEHPSQAYKILLSCRGMEPPVALAVLQHHERLDGSGYPGGFTAPKIHPFGRILAIADSYDAMISDRLYQERMSPFQAIQSLIGDMYTKLDAELCTTFLIQSSYAMVGNVVELEDGREGEIIYSGHYLSPRPILAFENGECLSLTDWKGIQRIRSCIPSIH
ncbi:MAG: HD-GYP domain-containing protein [Sporomusaceae bacterium]|nr:HD-GYP domain-containing protein [Sporomusaceae bacterium]